MSALFKNVCCSFITSLYFLTSCKGIFVKKENRLVSYYVGTRQNKSYVYSYIRQWQRILQIDKRQANIDRNKSSRPQTKNCYVSGNPGHFANQCNKRSSATCSICMKRDHLAKAYRSSGKFSSYSNCFISPLQKENNGSEKLFNRDHWVFRSYYKSKECLWKYTSLKKNVFEKNVFKKSIRDSKGNLTPVKGIGDLPIQVQLKDGKMAEMVITAKKCSLCTKLLRGKLSFSQYSRQFW